jgi:hypothetical protein
MVGLFSLLFNIVVSLSLDKSSYFVGEDIWLNVSMKSDSNKANYIFVPDKKYMFLRVFVRYADSNIYLYPLGYKWSSPVSKLVMEEYPTGDYIYLGKDSEYVVRLNLSRMFKIIPNRRYWVNVVLYPDIREDVEYFVVSQNSVFFSVKARKMEQKEKSIEEYEELIIEPDEVVRLFLSAEKEHRCADYLKYIYYDEFVKAYPVFAKRYYSGNEDEKMLVLRKFKSFLCKKREDYIITYKILDKKFVNKDTAYVFANVLRYGLPHPIMFRYKFVLIRYKNMFLISDIQASIEGEK